MSVCLCVYVCMWLLICECVFVCMSVCVYVSVVMWVCACVCMCVCLCVCMWLLICECVFVSSAWFHVRWWLFLPTMQFFLQQLLYRMHLQNKYLLIISLIILKLFWFMELKKYLKYIKLRLFCMWVMNFLIQIISRRKKTHISGGFFRPSVKCFRWQFLVK